MTKKELDKMYGECTVSRRLMYGQHQSGYKALAEMVVLQSFQDYIKGGISDYDFKQWVFGDEFALFTNISPNWFYQEAVKRRSKYKEWVIEYERFINNSKNKNRKLDNKGVEKSD